MTLKLFIVLIILLHVGYILAVSKELRALVNLIFAEDGDPITAIETHIAVMNAYGLYLQTENLSMSDRITLEDINAIWHWNTRGNTGLYLAHQLEELEGRFSHRYVNIKSLIEYFKKELDGLSRAFISSLIPTEQKEKDVIIWLRMRDSLVFLDEPNMQRSILEMTEQSKKICLDAFQGYLDVYGIDDRGTKIQWSTATRNVVTTNSLIAQICKEYRFTQARLIGLYARSFRETNFFINLEPQDLEVLIRTIACHYLADESSLAIVEYNIARNNTNSELFKLIFGTRTPLKSDEVLLLLKVLSIKGNGIDIRRSSRDHWMIEAARNIEIPLMPRICEQVEIVKLTKIMNSRLNLNIERYYRVHYPRYLHFCVDILNSDSRRKPELFEGDFFKMIKNLMLNTNVTYEPQLVIPIVSLQKELVEYALGDPSITRLQPERIQLKIDIAIQLCVLLANDIGSTYLDYLQIVNGFGTEWLQKIVTLISAETKYLLIARRVCQTFLEGNVQANNIIEALDT